MPRAGSPTLSWSAAAPPEVRWRWSTDSVNAGEVMPEPDDRAAELAEYSKFYSENVPRLFAFLLAMGWSVHDSADCVQETMIAALPPRWATLVNPLAWCRLAAYRKACTLAKQRREEPVQDPEQSGSPLIAPDTNFDHLEQRLQFLYWLNRLDSEKQREVVVWTYEGATTEEIATALNLNPATVRSTLRNARAALRRLREESGDR